MKSETEIRQHMSDLRTLKEAPCQCRGTEHEVRCVIGGNMMQAAIAVLAWVVGENETYQEAADRYRHGASEIITSG